MRRMVIILVLLFFLLMFGSSRNLYAQVQPAFIQIQEDRGLQSNTIYYIHVAKNGLLYIAHTKGLSSFDGNNFINYYNKDYPYTELTNIMETESGEIFCKAFNNILYQLKNDSIERVGYTASNFGFSPSSVYKENIVSIEKDSIRLDNFGINSRKTFPISNSTSTSASLKSIFIGVGEITAKPALVILDDKYNIYNVSNLYANWSNTHFSNGDIFLVKNKSVENVFFYNQNEQIKIRTSDEKCLVNYVVSTDSVIWICTTNGLFYRNRLAIGKPFQHILQGYNISGLSKTKENSVFLSTLGNGLLFIPNFDVKTHAQQFSSITAIAGYKEKLLIGDENGELFEYNAKTQKKEKLVSSVSQASIKFILKDSISGNQITSGQVSLIGSLEKKFSIKDYCYFNGNILLATNSGIYLYKNNEQQPSWLDKYILSKDPNDRKLYKLSFSNEHTSNIKFDSKSNTIFIGNYSGLFEMKDGYSNAVKLPEPNCVLKDICVWNGDLLLATKDKGMLKFDGVNYVKAFPTNATDGILYKFEIFKNELWVLGENAIFCYKNNGNTIMRYGNEVGVKAGSVKGMYIGDESVFLNYGKYIVELPKKIANKSTSVASFILNSVINVNKGSQFLSNSVLAHNENFVVFNFSLVAFANASNTHVAYSINNKELVHLSYQDRSVSLNFLRPENYTIKFFIVTDNKVSPLPAHEFSFIIKPPFYYTWWFALLTSILTVFILYFFVKRRVNNLKKEMALTQAKLSLEKELDKSTLASIKAQMNPHFIFNALNTIQSYVYMNDKRNASIYISKFSDLTRSILDMSNKDVITLAEEINALKIYLSLEKMRFEESFDYNIVVDNQLPKDSIIIPPMLLQPYVENAIKHGLLHRKINRKLNVSFNLVNESLKISIDDNGIGRKKSAELNTIARKNHTSFSTDANRKRIDILRQQYPQIELKIIDKISPYGEAEGTIVEILLPIK